MKNTIDEFKDLPAEMKDIMLEIVDLEENKLPVKKKLIEINSHFLDIINKTVKDNKPVYTNEKSRQAQLQIMIQNDATCEKYNNMLHDADVKIKKLKIDLEFKKNRFKMLNTLIPFLK